MSEEVELFKKALGRRVAHLRKEKGFTQAELGGMIDKDFQSISRIEGGKVNPSAYLIWQIAKVLETDIENLFTDK
ncbi:Helix-turn-helix domain protein [compost metagenome]